MTPGRRIAAEVGAALLVLLVAAFFWNRNHRALGDALRDAEAYRLRLSGQEVALAETKQQLEATKQDLLSRDVLLREAYEKARAAAPDSHVTGVAALRTGVITVPEEPQAPQPGPLPAPVAPAPAQAGSTPDPGAACVLRAGDGLSIVVNEIVLTTDKSNVILVGTAAAWRERPLPRFRLGQDQFQSALSDTSVLAPPTEPRWGAGLFGVCGVPGCSAGPLLALPPLRLLGLRLEVGAGIGVGGLGLLASGQAVVRW